MTEPIQKIKELKDELNCLVESLINAENSLVDTTLIRRYIAPTKILTDEEIEAIEKRFSFQFPISFKEFITKIGFGSAYRDSSHLDFSYFPCFLTNYAIKKLIEQNISVEKIENVEFDFLKKSFDNYEIQEIYLNDSDKELFLTYSLYLAHRDILILNGNDKGKICWEGEPEYREVKLAGKQIDVITYDVRYETIFDDAISSYSNAVKEIKQDYIELINTRKAKELINKYNYY